MKNTTKFYSVLSILVVLIVFQSSFLFAQENRKDSLLNEQLEYIQHSLTKSKPVLDTWWYGWLGAYSVATVGQGIVCLTSTDKPTRQDMALSGITTLLGAGLQLVTPLTISRRDLDNLKQMPDSSLQDQIKKLIVAEELFKSIAKKEKEGRGWQIHALNESVNLAAGLITWLGYKRTVWDGVSCFLLNTAITETQIWTQPTRTLKDYQNYCRKYKSGSNPLAYQPQPEFFLSTFPGGASLRIVF
jgi:hypothetical protein